MVIGICVTAGGLGEDPAHAAIAGAGFARFGT
jgi:hypothetical protein